ncbi:MAG: hypothetical protein ACMXX5_02345, partial [Candidatus Woesearchaeota archaeon]
PKYKRAKKAIRTIQEFISKNMKSEEVKLGKYLNLKVWEKGIKSPPHHVLIIAKKDENGIVTAELKNAPKEKEEAKPKKAEKKPEDKEAEASKKEEKEKASEKSEKQAESLEKSKKEEKTSDAKEKSNSADTKQKPENIEEKDSKSKAKSEALKPAETKPESK